MADIDCSACEQLKEDAPDFVCYGVTKTVCNSLKNDTGFNPTLTTLHDDCEDLDTANDCLVGIMDNEVEKHEACDWQKFMHKFIPNLHQMLKAIICAICGIWTNIHNLWKHVTDLEESQVDVCDLITSTIAPPTKKYGVMPLREGWTDIGTATDKIAFLPDDGSLNPYNKSGQGIGIQYAKLQVNDCKTGKCTEYEWIQPFVRYIEIKSGTRFGDVLWYCKKSDLQNACGFSDSLWQTYWEQGWNWREAMILYGASTGKSISLRLECNPASMGDDYIGIEYRGTSYPSETTLSYDVQPGPLGQVERLHTHSC